MNKSVIVFGLGRFGFTVASKLHEEDIEIMAVDKNYNKVQSIANHATVAVQADILDEDAMDELGLSNFDIAIIAIGTNLEASIAAALACSDANIESIYAKASSINHSRILKKLGLDYIIFLEIDMGERLARSIAGSNLLEFIHFSNDYSLMEVEAKDEWIGKSLAEIDFRNKYNLNVVAFRRNNKLMINEINDGRIQKDDILVLIGDTSSVIDLEEK